ncbi:hypothetical protein N9V95_00550, partial [bacterium]|nr:hypothetical protein [bacterium]
MRIILHIGLHKTGTTYLQHNLFANHAALKHKSCIFPKTGFMPVHAGAVREGASPGHQGIANGALQAAFGNNIRKTLREELKKSNCKTALISCENFSVPLATAETRVENINKVAAFLAGLGEVEIVAVVRRPDAYIEALYREHVTSLTVRESTSASQFAELNFRNMLDYKGVLQPWEKAFGGRLRVFSYDKLRDEGDYFTSFMDAVGISLEKKELSTSAKIYPSPSRDVIEALRIANAFGVEISAHSKAMHALIQCDSAQTSRSTSPNTSLAPVMRRELVEYCRRTSEKFLSKHNCELDWNFMVDDIEKSESSGS